MDRDELVLLLVLAPITPRQMFTIVTRAIELKLDHEPSAKGVA